MKDESTGQQQLEEWFDEKSQEYAIRAHQAHIDPDEFYRSGLETGYFKGYHDAESLSRWRKISVDGLPGELKKYLFISWRIEYGWDSDSVRVYDFAHAMPRDEYMKSRFTHWIELPTP